MSLQPIKQLFPYVEDQDDGKNIMYIRIEPALLYLEAGQTSKIKVYAVLTDGRNEEITHKVKWQSQHTTVGKVNEEGTITAVEAGSMTITAEFERHKAELVVSIDKREATVKKKNPVVMDKRLGRIALLTLAATLVVSGSIYGASQFLSSDENAEGDLTASLPVQAASNDPGNQAEPASEPPSNSAVLQTEGTPGPDGEKSGESAPSSAAAAEESFVQGSEGVQTTEPGSVAAGFMSALSQAVAATDRAAASTAAEENAQPEPTSASAPTPEQTQASSTPAATSAQTPAASKPASTPAQTPAASKPASTSAQKPASSTPKPADTKGKEKPKQPAANPKPETKNTAPSTQSNPAPDVKPEAAQPAAQSTAAAPQKPPAAASQPVKQEAVIALVPVEKGGKWGYKRSGEEEIVIPYQFDHAAKFSDGLAVVKKDGQFGYINSSGQVVIPIEYSYASSFSGGKATVKKDGKMGTIDKKGNFNEN
ncbi:WG repeat-containing protein [Brevibacillus ruminantium]|uniref:WG repeat-containing protein n=1 Tax=Brevibacillus ruminantium TaxID=2950604 RepID=A0ABY4WES8_9BACL|nr:WG repeat-containing protein [Brevibacillus ruminantium]USG65668.1 WG repeat-containing protein [Brevibacillus ruminantium]